MTSRPRRIVSGCFDPRGPRRLARCRRGLGGECPPLPPHPHSRGRTLPFESPDLGLVHRAARDLRGRPEHAPFRRLGVIWLPRPPYRRVRPVPRPCSASLDRRSGDPRSPSTNSPRSNGSSVRSRSPCAWRYSRSSTARGSKGASRSPHAGRRVGHLAGDQRGRDQDAHPAPGRQRPLGMPHRRGLRAAFEHPWSVLAVGGGSRALRALGAEAERKRVKSEGS